MEGLQLVAEDICEGCGAPLQSRFPNDPGFVPEKVLKRQGDIGVCRRCYRINHYGKDDTGPSLSNSETWALAFDVVTEVDACIMTVDVLDFEGSFMPDLAKIAGDKLFVAANKVDLLPNKTPTEEVGQWVEDRLRALDIPPRGVFPVSAATGYGARVLLDTLKKKVGRGGKIGVVGATNVGKSTLLQKWLGESKDGPTVSRFAGTTVGVVERRLDKEGLVIYDTPGLLVGGRLSQSLCQTCGAKLVPSATVTSKLLRIESGRSILLGGLCRLTPEDTVPGQIALAFAAADVKIERVSNKSDQVVMDRLSKAREEQLCGPCHQKLSLSGWEEVVLQPGEMEDVAIHGLGWISPRRSGMTLRVTLPAGAMVTTRPRLIGPKEPIRR